MANKIARIAYAVIRTGKPYDPPIGRPAWQTAERPSAASGEDRRAKRPIADNTESPTTTSCEE